jgi:tetratricopeptide (TPR) repeat protein
MKTAWFLAATLVLVPSSLAVPDELVTEDYAELVHRCMKGQSRDAVRALSRAGREDIARAVQDYGGRWLTEPQIRAAVLLHTEAILMDEGDFRFHVDAARHWIRRAEPNERKDFERHWYILLAYHFMGSVRTSQARAVLESAILEFPSDGELRLALGTVYETGAWIENDTTFLIKAAEQFHLILGGDPNSVEVHLRLGHVLAMQNKTNEALAELEWVLSRTEDPQFQLVSHLTIGMLHKKAGRLDEAIESYRNAMTLAPRCQAAAMALAHMLHASGDHEGSLRCLEQFFKQAELGRNNDPWFGYLLGHFDRYEALLREMRADVRP